MLIDQDTLIIQRPVQRVREYAAKEGSEVFVLCAKIEEEISDLDEADKKEFLACADQKLQYGYQALREVLELGLGRLFIVSRSVCVRMMLFSNAGLT